MKQTPDDLCGGSTPSMFGITRRGGRSLQFVRGARRHRLLLLLELRQPVAKFVNLLVLRAEVSLQVRHCLIERLDGGEPLMRSIRGPSST